MEVLQKGLRLYICHQNLPIVVHSIFTFIVACCISISAQLAYLPSVTPSVTASISSAVTEVVDNLQATGLLQCIVLYRELELELVSRIKSKMVKLSLQHQSIFLSFFNRIKDILKWSNVVPLYQ